MTPIPNIHTILLLLVPLYLDDANSFLATLILVYKVKLSEIGVQNLY